MSEKMKFALPKGKKKSDVPMDALALKTEEMRRQLMIKRNLPLFAMLAIPLIYFAVFSYAPMFGLIMAFQNFKLKDGLLGSDWAGMQNFKMIFTTPNMYKIIFNTLRLGILSVVVAFPFPIAIAIMLNEITNKHFKKISQTILYLPHFFSWVVLGGMVITCFSYAGPVNRIIQMFGGEPIGFLTNVSSWLAVYVGAGVWKEMGYDAIIYLAALTSIDPSYYEAARVDGATKWQQIKSITIPCLMPTIIIVLILSIGKVTSVGFDRVYVLTNAAVSEVSQVVSVFSYEFGTRKGSYSIATAMGLFDSLLSLILVLVTNHLAKRTDNALF